jgi:hypothetical protein
MTKRRSSTVTVWYVLHFKDSDGTFDVVGRKDLKDIIENERGGTAKAYYDADENEGREAGWFLGDIWKKSNSLI